MAPNPKSSSGIGLERSCGQGSGDWMRHSDAAGGVELMEAWFRTSAYRKHRHDTYAISFTESGVQAFDYRGVEHFSLPGQVVVLHPDELHDGHAGTQAGFGYRQLYIEPALIFEAVRSISGRACALPFVRDPVLGSSNLASAIQAAFRGNREPLEIDDLILHVAEELLKADPSCGNSMESRHLDMTAIERARQFLDTETARVVRSAELEQLTGLTRYELARQFRRVHGTSPYRYSLMRRLGFARGELSQQRPLVDVALESGFSDQAHFTRMFTAAFGITPARYSDLCTTAPLTMNSRPATT
jgi:AraC-like DNA-binding protein